jgi:hypothetical protein
MLPENIAEFEYYARLRKADMDTLSTYVNKGDYKAAIGFLYYLSDAALPYLAYVLQEDEAGRIAKDFSEWNRTQYEEKRRSRMQFNR